MNADISERGAAALELLANELVKAVSNINDANKNVYETVTHLSDLGIYASRINEIMIKMRERLKTSAESVVTLSKLLTDQAEEIRNLIGFLGAGTSAAPAAQNGADGTRAIQNIDMALELMSKGLAEDADFGNLDPRVSQELARAIEETHKLFPELHLSFVGSAQRRNERVREQLTRRIEAQIRQNAPFLSNEDVKIQTQYNVDMYMAKWEFSDDTIAEAVTNAKGDLSIYEGIAINEKYGGDYDYLRSVRESNVRSGFKPVNCGTPKATMDHELGHMIADFVGAAKDKRIKKMYKQFLRLSDSERRMQLSAYAAKNIDEFIAEAWSEKQNNPDCRPCAKAVADIMEELYFSGSNRLRNYTLTQ